VLRTLSLRQPASLEVCTLLDRPYRRLVDVPVRYVGFTVPDDFFVGYGFDYRQLHRNLPYLAHLRL
jgi:hypoxanthine phosphoribosyltransferase